MGKTEKADKMQLYQVKIGEETRLYQEGTSYGQIAEEFQKDYKMILYWYLWMGSFRN